MKPWLIAWVLLLSTNAMAQPPGESPFDRFDRNQDGKLSRDEFPEPIRARFVEIDTDKDGFVSRAEDAAFLARMRPGPGGPGGRVAVPDSVKVEKDRPYAASKNPRQTLDLYLPKTPRSDKPLPVVVNIHGGAWRGGDKSMGASAIISLVSSGDYAGVSINYRLSGEAVWPSQIFDCKAAIRWVRAHATEYHLDPDRIGVIGGSAGGHLAAMLGTSVGVEALEGDVGTHKGLSTKVRCVVDEFGPSDLLAMGGNHDDANSPEALLIGGALQAHQDTARAASPITYVTRDDPPFLILHGDADPLVPFTQSERLSRALKSAGVDCTFIPVLGAGHGDFRNPEVFRRIHMFFDRHLLERPATISSEPIPNEGAQPKR